MIPKRMGLSSSERVILGSSNAAAERRTDEQNDGEEGSNTMWLSRITIKNFRNFKLMDVKLGKHAVVLGENKGRAQTRST
jgi:hypothetical protein